MVQTQLGYYLSRSPFHWPQLEFNRELNTGWMSLPSESY